MGELPRSRACICGDIGLSKHQSAKDRDSQSIAGDPISAGYVRGARLCLQPQWCSLGKANA